VDPNEVNLLELNQTLSREVTGKPLGLIDQAPGLRKRGIMVNTGQRWIPLGRRDLNPPIDCHEQLHIAWYIQVTYGDVSPAWLVAHSEE
jgi:hypothetical protein